MEYDRIARNLEPAKTIPSLANIQKWAIIVRISKYKDESLNLKYADRDAEELYKLLLTPVGGGFEEDHIKKLINEEATTFKNHKGSAQLCTE